jgi:glutaredoxin
VQISVFSKAGCGKCVAAKEKLKKMGFQYKEYDVDYAANPHDGWRDDESTDVLAAYTLMDTLPIIRVGEDYYDYSGAMKQLKRLKSKKRE